MPEEMTQRGRLRPSFATSPIGGSEITRRSTEIFADLFRPGTVHKFVKQVFQKFMKKPAPTQGFPAMIKEQRSARPMVRKGLDLESYPL